MSVFAASADEPLPWKTGGSAPKAHDPLAGVTARYYDPETGEDLFTIGQLATVLGGRRAATLRGWEAMGWLPCPTEEYKGSDPYNPASQRHGRRRLYTRDQVLGLYLIAKDEGILEKHAKPITQTNFTKRAIKLFQDLLAYKRQRRGVRGY